MIRKILLVIVFIATYQVTSNVAAVELNKHPELLAVADKLINQHDFNRAELESIFAKATIQQSVLDAMTNPAEYKFTWGKYRNLFIQPDRIQQGVEFWQKYETELSRATETYGVPSEVIVAIIGVESKFGKYKGKHKVLDSLVTLITGYPRRSKFFADELKHFLILTKENNLASDQILGSYAGAVGFPQFISSSYRNYAVDFSGDGKTDLINQPVDAIGSVANYFVKNGWKQGETVITKVDGSGLSDDLVGLANRKLKPQYSATKLRSLGANLSMNIADDERLNVLVLDASQVVDDASKTGVHLVRAGDTACQIAEKYKVRCKALFEVNGLNSKGSIYRGQRLKIPGMKSKNSSSMRDPAYFYTHANFYAITRYNHSVLYAMAVHELSQAIAKEKAKY